MLALLAGVSPLLAAEQVGQVTFGGLPVPGATVIALQGETQVVTSTDLEGVYRLGDLPDGVWTIRVEMQGFAPVVREVAIGADEPPATWELALLTLAEIAAVPAQTDTTGAPGTAPAATAQPDAAAGSRASAAAAVNPSPGPAPNPGSNPGAGPDEGNPFANESADSALDAADGLLINGSVNNSAASPFAQPRAFGNSRPGRRSLYNGMLGSLLGNSAWDARPFSFSTQQAPKPSYRDVQFLGTFGGPVRIPRLFRNAANLFVGYQRSGDTNATTQSALVPTRVERGGDFSQSRDAFGRPVQIVDPRTGLPFPGNVIPPERLSPQAASLLGYYPLPSLDASGFNHQAPIVAETRQDSVQSRWNQALTNRNQISATVAYRRSRTTTRSLFAFDDQAGTSALDLQAAWFRRLSQFVSVRLRPQFTRLTNTATPHFAGRTNVSGEAGIRGNNQDPQNWGPPSLLFADGVAGLSTAQYASTETQTQALGAEGYWFRGRHNITLGGDVRRHAIDVQSQQDARGTFAFTGAATGSALADFLLGLPTTGSIAFGNADKYLRAWSYDAYVTDDWRVGPSLTLNLGIRWEFEAPITERFGRLVNLDVAPGFQAVAPVLATSPVGPLTGSRYPNALMRADWRGIQPRLAAAWRPIPGSSLVVRAGYGIYRNTGVYQPIATLLAQQPPLSTTFSVESTALAPLTLADGLLVARARAFNTFAVDPDFRAGYARNWQASVQRDLPFSLTVVGTYSGAKGSHLLQQLLPNTQPPGAVNPCPACPAGFAYLTSGGRSLRHAGQLQLRRRLRNGFTATVQYTLATSTDNASAFTGGGLGGAVIAQDWLDLEAEHGPSSFDRRHLVTAQVQYTTGAGITGGTLIDGWKGRLFKDWTFTGQLTTGSGLPLTPVLLTPVRGTGVVGTVRASTTGADPNAIPDGYFLNPAAYAPPAPGEWGNAGRNSVTGPAQFSLNGSVARTFRVGDRLNLDWRIDATNLLNRVTYGGVNMLVTSPQFGLPNRANTMRKLQSSLRVRF
ncbi:MAG: TonB-dependent receptor [Acidobacteria bacterium]|nr:TonB-dependent receptor [Acidobacteriota bacterium]